MITKPEQSGQNSPGTKIETDETPGISSSRKLGRRRFMKNLALGGAGASLLRAGATFADGVPNQSLGQITNGDAAILRFLAAAEILETDLWVQYTEFADLH